LHEVDKIGYVLYYYECGSRGSILAWCASPPSPLGRLLLYVQSTEDCETETYIPCPSIRVCVGASGISWPGYLAPSLVLYLGTLGLLVLVPDILAVKYWCDKPGRYSYFVVVPFLAILEGNLN